MTGRSIRTFIRFAAAAALVPMAVTAVRAADAACTANLLAAIALSNPLDRREEPAAEFVCGVVAPAVIEEQAAHADRGGRSEPGTTKAAAINDAVLASSRP